MVHDQRAVVILMVPHAVARLLERVDDRARHQLGSHEGLEQPHQVAEVLVGRGVREDRLERLRDLVGGQRRGVLERLLAGGVELGRALRRAPAALARGDPAPPDRDVARPAEPVAAALVGDHLGAGIVGVVVDDVLEVREAEREREVGLGRGREPRLDEPRAPRRAAMCERLRAAHGASPGGRACEVRTGRCGGRRRRRLGRGGAGAGTGRGHRRLGGSGSRWLLLGRHRGDYPRKCPDAVALFSSLTRSHAAAPGASSRPVGNLPKPGGRGAAPRRPWGARSSKRPRGPARRVYW